MLLLNHAMRCLEEGTVSMDDYNYPILQPYRYKQIAKMKGAEVKGQMAVEFAISLRVEFIPAGASKEPMHDIYFKILKAGSCNIAGGVLGWPSLNVPSPGGEGLGWQILEDGFHISSSGVTAPRLDDHRKLNYRMAVDRYVASAREFCYMGDVIGESSTL